MLAAVRYEFAFSGNSEPQLVTLQAQAEKRALSVYHTEQNSYVSLLHTNCAVGTTFELLFEFKQCCMQVQLRKLFYR